MTNLILFAFTIIEVFQAVNYYDDSLD